MSPGLLAALDPTFDARLSALHAAALKAGLWQGTYAASNPAEYWAEAVKSYFDCNRAADPPDGVHNAVRTREGLRAHDAGLFALVDEALEGNPWRWTPAGAHAGRWR